MNFKGIDLIGCAPYLFFIKLRIAEFWFGTVSENFFDLLLNRAGIVFIDNYYVFIFASKICFRSYSLIFYKQRSGAAICRPAVSCFSVHCSLSTSGNPAFDLFNFDAWK